MNIVITGSSGMIGKAVLSECLDSPDVRKIRMVNRKHIEIDNPKLQEVIAEDFFNLQDIKQDLGGSDACFFCAGTTSAGKTEQEYSKLTYELTKNFADAFYEENPNSVFCYVSGAGTDSTGKGKAMWARVKGKTENAILNTGFKSAYMFRPGYVQPMKGIKSKTKLYSFLYMLLSPLYWLILRHISSSSTSSVNVGKAMVNAVIKQPETRILNNREINELAAG